ncbi:unnamed protein product [Gordionus sp. m RMFG-2023]
MCRAYFVIFIFIINPTFEEDILNNNIHDRNILIEKHDVKVSDITPGELHWPTEFYSNSNALLPEGPLELNDAIFKDIIKSYDLVFINYHAEWCPYSKMLNPIFEEAWVEVKKKNPDAKVIFAKIDCDKNMATCSVSNVSKYPSLKIYRLGSPRSEYRGQRSVNAIAQYINEQIDYRVQNLSTISQLNSIPLDKSSVITFFNFPPPSIFYKTLQMTGFLMKEDCNIYVAVGPEFQDIIRGLPSKSVFKPAHVNETETYSGAIEDLDKLSHWIFTKCTPFVREITRENAEEITEKGLPLLIIFYKNNDLSPLPIFKKIVESVLFDVRDQIQPVYANFESFKHPLYHLGKAENDLPVIAIDSFAHMFPFPHKFSDLDPSFNHSSHNLLLTFVNDLFSKKLHRDFHAKSEEIFKQNVIQFQFQGFDFGTPEPDINSNQIGNYNNQADKLPAYQVPHDHQKKLQKKSIPESIFNKLQPSYTRYTILRRDRDEL